jgi:hypothetical protein
MKNMLSKLRLIVLAMTAGGALAWWTIVPERPPVQASGPTIEQIQLLAELVTLKVELADVRMTELRGTLGGLQAILMVRGEVAVGVDLAEARFESVDQRNRHAVLLLPQPKVVSVRLDHERTKLVGIWPWGLWMVVMGGREADSALVNRAYQEAQQGLGDAARDTSLLERSREQAQKVLRQFCEAMGWTIEIRWSP